MKIKYLGVADVRRLPKGSNFGGQLAEGLSEEVVFDRSNNWIIDTKEAKVSDEAAKLLVEDPNFRDVSDLKTIPNNAHQTTYLGMSARTDAEEVLSTSGTAAGDTGTTTGGSTSDTTSRRKSS